MAYDALDLFHVLNAAAFCHALGVATTWAERPSFELSAWVSLALGLALGIADDLAELWHQI